MSGTETETEGARGLPGRLLAGLAAAGGAILFLIMCLVSYSVIRRYVLNDPLLGDVELVEIGMSLVVMLAMPFATLSGAHIRVDILDARIGEWGRFLGGLLARGVGMVVLLLLVGKTWDKTFDAVEYNDVTNMMEIPVWIPYGAITIGMGLYAAILAWQLLLQLRSGVRGHE